MISVIISLVALLVVARVGYVLGRIRAAEEVALLRAEVERQVRLASRLADDAAYRALGVEAGAVPDPGRPDGRCGVPAESEPYPESARRGDAAC